MASQIRSGIMRPTRQPVNMGQFSKVVVTLMEPYIPFAQPSQEARAHTVPIGGA